MGDGCDRGYELMEAETEYGVIVFGTFLDKSDTSGIEVLDASGAWFWFEVGDDEVMAVFMSMDDTNMGVGIFLGIERGRGIVIVFAEEKDEEVSFARVLEDRFFSDALMFGFVAVKEFLEGSLFTGPEDKAFPLEEGTIIDRLKMFHGMAPLGCVWVFVFRLNEKRRP